jgi:tripartite-type tricarboxylate transporter receptor subunit TctC
MRSVFRAFALALALAAAPAATVEAQDWPTQPVRVIVPYAPGGSSDTLGRLVAEGLSEKFGQQFVVENRPGGGGTVGSDQVADAEPDGYTLVASGIGSHVVAPAINPNVGYDPMADFTHVAILGGPPTVLIAHPSLEVDTLQELIDLAKSGERRLTYASPGAGTHAHLIGESFKNAAGIEMEHIPYRGAGEAITDVVGGHVPVASMTLASAAEQIRAGTVKGLAVTSAERLPQFPDIPTYSELGYPDLVAKTWFALSGPAGLPEDIVTKLNEGVNEVMASEKAKARLEQDAFEPEPLDPAGVNAYFQSEMDRWVPIAKASGATAE